VQFHRVFAGHVAEHVAEPVIRAGGEEIRLDAELCAAEGRGNGVPAKRDRVFRRDVLVVAGRNVIGHDGHIDIGVADE